MNNIAHASGKNLKVSPRKARLVINMIRGQKVRFAVGFLENTRRTSNPYILNILRSAIANVEQKFPGFISDKLYVTEARVDKGYVLKRFRARAMGRGAPVLKKTSHIKISVGSLTEDY